MVTRELKRGELPFAGLLGLPDGDGPFPAVVVIHELYGLNDNIRDITQRFAQAGYAALAVDMFSGRNRVACVARLMTGLLTGAIDRFGMSDLRGALAHLAQLSQVDGDRVGAIGFCMEAASPSPGGAATHA